MLNLYRKFILLRNILSFFLSSLLGIPGNVNNHPFPYMPLESCPGLMEIKEFQTEMVNVFAREIVMVVFWSLVL